LILALQNYSNSVGSYYAAIAQYNSALATFEFAKGAIMEHDSVFISEGPLPRCAQVRAVEHERQRTEAIVLRDLDHPVMPASCAAGPPGTVPAPPHGPNDMVLSLPVLEHAKPPPPEMPQSPAAAVPSLPSANESGRP
jgi:hypothetical protein